MKITLLYETMIFLVNYQETMFLFLKSITLIEEKKKIIDCNYVNRAKYFVL